MDVNYFGPLQMLQQFAPILAKNRASAWVNIGSAAGLTNIAFFPTYSASKAALHSLTQASRALLAQQGSRPWRQVPRRNRKIGETQHDETSQRHA